MAIRILLCGRQYLICMKIYNSLLPCALLNRQKKTGKKIKIVWLQKKKEEKKIREWKKARIADFFFLYFSCCLMFFLSIERWCAHDEWAGRILNEMFFYHFPKWRINMMSNKVINLKKSSEKKKKIKWKKKNEDNFANNVFGPTTIETTWSSNKTKTTSTAQQSNVQKIKILLFLCAVSRTQIERH